MSADTVAKEVGVGEKAVDTFLEQLAENAKLNPSDLHILQSALRVTSQEVQGRLLAAMVRAELRYLGAVESAEVSESGPDPLLETLTHIAKGQDRLLVAVERLAESQEKLAKAVSGLAAKANKSAPAPASE